MAYTRINCRLGRSFFAKCKPHAQLHSLRGLASAIPGSKSELEEFSCRLAQPSDFQEVMGISEGIYNGQDYLPFTFHRWLKGDNSIVLLALMGSKIVGLGGCCVVDDGETCIIRAARVLPELRHHGIWTQTRRALLNEFVLKRFPNVVRQRFTCTSRKFIAQHQGRQLVEYDILSYFVPDQQLNRHLQLSSACPIEIESCTKEYFSNVILSSPVAQKLFPDNILFIGNMLPFFKPIPSNVPYIFEEINCVFTDKTSHGLYPRSISFGTLSERVNSVHWVVSVYTEDPTLLEAHLIRQFNHACRLINGEFFFFPFTNKTLKKHEKNVIENTLQLQAFLGYYKTNDTVGLIEKELPSGSV